MPLGSDGQDGCQSAVGPGGFPFGSKLPPGRHEPPTWTWPSAASPGGYRLDSAPLPREQGQVLPAPFRIQEEIRPPGAHSRL
jgi:hypothetical protein